MQITDYMLGLGLRITTPIDGEIITSDPVAVPGLFRVFPRPSDRILVFSRSSTWYYPQMPIEWNRDQGT
jgi:hypothetical protein